MAPFTFCFNLRALSPLAEQNEVRNDCKNVLMGEKQMKLFILKIKEGKVKSETYCENIAEHPSSGVLGSRSLLNLKKTLRV